MNSDREFVIVQCCEKCHNRLFWPPNVSPAKENLLVSMTWCQHSYHPDCIDQMFKATTAKDERGNLIICTNPECRRVIWVIRQDQITEIVPITERVQIAPLSGDPNLQKELTRAQQLVTNYERIMNDYQETIRECDSSIRTLRNLLATKRDLNCALQAENAKFIIPNIPAPRCNSSRVACRLNNANAQSEPATSTTESGHQSKYRMSVSASGNLPASPDEENRGQQQQDTGTSGDGPINCVPFRKGATNHSSSTTANRSASVATSSHAAVAMSKYENESPLNSQTLYNADDNDGTAANPGFRPIQRSTSTNRANWYNEVPESARMPQDPLIRIPTTQPVIKKVRPPCTANLAKCHNRFYRKFGMDSGMLKPFYPLNAFVHEFTTLGIFVGDNVVNTAVAAQDILLIGDGLVFGVAQWIMLDRDIREFMHMGLYGKTLTAKALGDTLHLIKALPPRMILSIGNFDALRDIDGKCFKQQFQRIIRICRHKGVREMYAVPLIRYADQNEVEIVAIESIIAVDYSNMLTGAYHVIDPSPWFQDKVPVVDHEGPMYQITEHADFAKWIRNMFIPPGKDSTEAERAMYRQPPRFD
ncbi:uncharacterized protein LOC135843550 [Planococcus citri]|uniref:uncharacterized protein LOC135843550 n=1 Tax=Planococcus citri TaxID=170843 RepID=UPI0031F86237